MSADANSRVLAMVKMLRKHWALIVACAIVASGAVLLYSKSMPKVYQATTLLEIDPRPTQPLGEKQSDVVDIGAGSYWDTRDYYETQYKIISSDRVLGAVVRDLGLAADGDFLATTWLNSQVDHIKQDLEKDENSLYDFKQRNDLPSTSINEASNMLRVEMQELDTALTRTRTKKQELLARHEELSKVSADDPDKLPASELLSSQFLQAMRTQYQDAVRERAVLIAEGKGDNHPLVRRADE